MDEQRTSDGRYLVKDVMRLAADPVFNARYSADPELNRLMNPEVEQEQLDEENVQTLGFTRRILGVDVPPARMGHFRLLTVVDNEFMRPKQDWSRGFEYALDQVTEALFVLRFGAAALAVANVSPVFRWRKAITRWTEEARSNPALFAAVLDAERRVAEAMAPWDTAVLRFAEKHIRVEDAETLAGAMQELNNHLAHALDGFDLLPQIAIPQDAKAQKKTSARGAQSLRLRCALALSRFARRLLPKRRDGE